MTAASKILQSFIKKTPKGRQPKYGELKVKLENKVRDGKASEAEKEALKELRKKDVEATISQKAKQSRSSRKQKITLPEVKGINKKKGGKISKPRGCGAAQKGYGKAMKCGGYMKGKK